MLSPKEIKTFIRLVKKIHSSGHELPEAVFDALCKILPSAACEIIVSDRKQGFLLTYRKDKFWKGWHFPGSVLRNHEEFVGALKRIAKEELDSDLRFYKFLFPMNYSRGKRGHSVTFVFWCALKGSPKTGKFFKIMPKNIIAEHKQLWKKVKKFV